MLCSLFINVLSAIPLVKMSEVTAVFKNIHAQQDVDSAKARVEAVTRKLGAEPRRSPTKNLPALGLDVGIDDKSDGVQHRKERFLLHCPSKSRMRWT